MTGRASVVALTLIMAAWVTAAGEPLTPVPPPAGEGPRARAERKGPLKDLPSKPKGEHLEKIKALGDNSWVNLGSPAPDPKWGRARGRAWGGKAFALAPDIRGAYFTGEGIHAFVKPDGHGMDDYWVYDINAHRWICIYPGTNVKDFTPLVKSGDLRVGEHGLVANKAGQPMPGHLFIHAWGFLTYDTDRRKFALLALGPGYSNYYFPGLGFQDKGRFDGLKEGLGLLQEQMKAKTAKSSSPWFYDTATGEFESYPATNRCPVQTGHGQLLYIQSKKQYLFIADGGQVAFFDPDRKSWTAVAVKGKGPAGYDIGACYDSKRDRVYIGAIGPKGKTAEDGNAILVYDIGSETWIRPNAKGDSPSAWTTNQCSVHYDAASDLVLVLHYSDKKAYVYNPETGAWGDPLPMPDGMMKHSDCGHAFYDPELNAHFVFFAGDSVDNGVMWAYRYKKAAK